jgi:hypothetical protein
MTQPARKAATIIEAMDDRRLLGHAFDDMETWKPWRAVLKALFALPMTTAEIDTFSQLTGRGAPNRNGYSEFWAICGRRSGKSRILALVAAYLACFRDYTPYLAPGERGRVMVMAANRAQAKSIFDFISGMIEGSPLLSRMIENITADSIELKGRVSIEVHASSFRGIRGRTTCAVLMDEVAFWQADDLSANPDQEVLNAVRPSMATIPGSMLLAASSPYARRGILFRAFDRHYANDESLPLVIQAPTRAMNPTIKQSFIDQQLEEDEAANRSEYLAEWRSDIENFVNLDVVKSCAGSYTMRHPDSALKYFAFVDPASGSGADSFTAAIAHREGNQIHVDAVLSRKPSFSPAAVIDEFCATLRQYRVTTVSGDRYAGEFPREHFRRNDIRYDVAKKTKSELYQGLLPLLNSGRITIPDDPTLIKQIVSLERRIARSGRESIDSPPGKHEDSANAVAGVSELCVVAGLVVPAMFGTYANIPSNNYWSRSKFDGACEEGSGLEGGFASSRKI